MKIPETTRKVVLATGADGRYAWRLTQAPTPSPRDDQVLVRIHAVALQRADVDLLVNLNSEKGKPHDRDGLVVCSDGAGEVVAVGNNVSSVAVGDRVVGLYLANYVDGPLTAAMGKEKQGYTVNGALGEYVTLPDTGVAPMPKGLNYEEAATLPTSAVTAWMATVGGHAIARGATALIQGTGGVSIFALQFAIASGARVIVTSSSDEKLRRLATLGATEGINHKRAPEWGSEVLRLTEGRGADLVVDVGGKATIVEAMKSLAYQGTLSVVGGLGSYDYQIPALELIVKAATARGVFIGSRADYLRMVEFIERHQIRPVIERTYAFEDYESALLDLAAGDFVGKLVVRVSAD